jgi:hypothetical protein
MAPHILAPNLGKTCIFHSHKYGIFCFVTLEWLIGVRRYEQAM